MIVSVHHWVDGSLVCVFVQGRDPSPGSSEDTEAFFGGINEKLQLSLLSAAEAGAGQHPAALDAPSWAVLRQGCVPCELQRHSWSRTQARPS